MKKLLSTILLITCIFSYTAYATDNNIEIVFSETFKGDLSRWSWNSPHKYLDPYLEYDKKNLYISEYLKFQYSSHFLPDGESYFKSIPFEIEPECTYTIATDIIGSGRIYIEFLDKNGSVIYPSNYELNIKAKDWNTWRCFSFMVEAPNKAVRAQIGLDVNINDMLTPMIFFDNVIVCKGMIGFEKDIKKRQLYAPLAEDDSSVLSNEKDIMLLENFEAEESNWIPVDKNSEKKAIPKSTRVYTGKKALLLLDDQEDINVKTQSPRFTAYDDVKYNVSFMAYNEKGKGASLSIDFLDKEGRQISSESINVSTVKKGWHKYEITAVSPEGTISLRISAYSLAGKGENYIDNIKITADLSNVEKDVIEYNNLYNNSMVLIMNYPAALVNGEKKFIDEGNKNVVAQTINSRTMVPVRFIAENFNWDVLWNGETQTVTLKNDNKTVEIVLGETEIKIDDSVVTTDVPAQSIRERTMLPLRFFAETVMGKYVHWDNLGLIVITDEKNTYLENNQNAANKLIEDIKKL